MDRLRGLQIGCAQGGDHGGPHGVDPRRDRDSPAADCRAARQRKSVYVIVGPRNGPVNDRVNGVLNLRDHYEKLTLVSGGAKQDVVPHVIARPFPPPTAILKPQVLRPIRKGVERIVYFPSRHVRYAKVMARRLSPLVKADLDLGLGVTVLTCVPPHDVAIAGLMIKRDYPEVRWVMDWQDFWSYDENYMMRVPRFYHGRLRALEREIMEGCDLNVVTNRLAQDVLIQRFQQTKDRTAYIHHHFDGFIPGSLESQRAGQRPIRLGFLGTLFKPPRVPGYKLVEVLREINESTVAIEFHVHGGVPKEIERQYKGYLGDWLFLHGHAPHQESVKEISGYDASVLFLEDLDNSRIVMSIKLPAYFAAQRPIIAIVPEHSANAEIVRRSGMGLVLPVAGDLHNMLEDLIGHWQSKMGGLCRDQNYVRSFMWKEVSRRWNEALGANGC